MKEAFPPVIAPSARILILGTMPGEESLARKGYYANPRNQFWRITQAIYGIPQNRTCPHRCGERNGRSGYWPPGITFND